jgi:hypothetical protein
MNKHSSGRKFGIPKKPFNFITPGNGEMFNKFAKFKPNFSLPTSAMPNFGSMGSMLGSSIAQPIALSKPIQAPEKEFKFDDEVKALKFKSSVV